MNKVLKDLPEWGEMPKKRGLYLSLSHGREFPQQAMKGRGFPGPKLGPLLYVKTHYGQQVTLRFQNRRDARRFFPDTTISISSLEVIEGTLVYDKKCYGDWDICYIAAEFLSPCLTTVHPSLSTANLTRKRHGRDHEKLAL